jgi:dolichyl-phosphate-mannose--protein O-mannosyl transferase
MSVGVVSVVFALLRLVRITFPSSRVFDEVYSPAFAWKFLHGEAFFDVHPILAELPHTIGLLLFGDTPLGWRFSPWLWGILFTWGTALTAWLLTGRRLAGVLAALLVSLDTAIFIYGRTGLPDMFLLSQFSLALVLFFASARIQKRPWAILAALGSGVFLGNVVATKWLGLAGIVSLWLWIGIHLTLFFVRRLRGTRAGVLLLPNIPWWLYPVCFLLVPAGTYGLWLLPLLGWHWPPAVLWQKITDWHRTVWNYHAYLDATHPYGSKWWEWPILRHPVLFFYEAEGNGRRVINASGNVVLWWSGFAALIVGALSLFRTFRAAKLWAVGSALTFWLP